MANVKISELPVLTSVDSSDLIPIIQGGVTYASSAQNIVSGTNSLGILEIVADGNIGGPYSLSFQIGGLIPENTIGITNVIPALGSSFYIYNPGPSFTAMNLSFPSATFFYNLNFMVCPTLETISAPSLIVCYGGMDFYNCTNLKTMDFPNLIAVNNNSNISFGGNPNLTNVNFPLLEGTPTLNITTSDPGITGFRQSMFPSLRKASFNVGYNYLPSFEIDFPLLTDLTNVINGGSGCNLTNINLPNLVNMYYQITLSYFSILTNVILGSVGITKTWGGPTTGNPYIDFQYCALTQTSIDNLLMVMASIDGTNGTTAVYSGSMYLNGGMNSSPGPSGIIAISTLQGRGFYIATN